MKINFFDRAVHTFTLFCCYYIRIASEWYTSFPHVGILISMRRMVFYILFSMLSVFQMASAQENRVVPDSVAVQNVVTDTVKAPDSSYIGKVLFIGDSMTGWMAERLNAYGDKNGFEVATIVWDGSTISKWADSDNLTTIIDSVAPDAVFISLGMNELFQPDPEAKLKTQVEEMVAKMGDTPFLWIGPPSWPGHAGGSKLDSWLASELGSKRFFSSLDLDLQRQGKKNPHPSREGIGEWIDDVVLWIPQNTDLKFRSLDPPEKGALSRGKTFIYKRMKENL